MKEDYKLKGPTAQVSFEVEKEVAQLIESMEKHSKFSKSELANTALKMFISRHKDFLPPQER